MRHRTIIAVLAAALCGLAAAPGASAQVQERQDEPRYQRDDDDEDDQDRSRRFALGLGAGVVEPDEEGEIYYTAAFRIRLFENERERRDDDWRYASRGDIQAYLEPEVGYWERDEVGISESDLNVGVNAIGVVPGQAVDYFFGVGLGLHFLDTQIDVADPTVPDVDESDSHFGGNFQVGLDIHLGRTVSLFGAGRFDVIEGVDETLQGKVYMGLRLWF